MTRTTCLYCNAELRPDPWHPHWRLCPIHDAARYAAVFGRPTEPDPRGRPSRAGK